MTQNTYPEGLDELVDSISASLYGDTLPMDERFARALLDDLAKRGYVLVDAKKQEPVVYAECRQCDACGHTGINDSDAKKAACHNCDWNGDAPEEDKCPECGSENVMAAACPKCGGRYSLIAEEEIAIPGRVALPDGWVPVPVEPTREMLSAGNLPWEDDADLSQCYRAMLSAATTPPTQPQGDGSLRRDAEHEYAIKEGARISACEGYFNARPQIDCLDRRRVFEAGFDRGYDAAMEASNG